MGVDQLTLSERRGIQSHRARRQNVEGYRGIYWDAPHQRWRAVIVYRGRRIRLGRFRSPEDAAYAYNCAARKYYGDFAAVNVFNSQVIFSD